MFKTFQKIIFVLLFVTILAGPMISWAVLSWINLENPKIMETLDIDLNEKRNKATLSEPINMSTIIYEVESYYNDRLPFRSVLITFKRYMDAKIEEPYKDKIEMALLKLFSKKKSESDKIDREIAVSDERLMDDTVDKYLNHGLYKDEIDPYDDTIEFPIKYLNNPRVIVGQSNWLYLNENNIPYYQGLNKLISDEKIKEHIKPYIKLKKMCDEVGKKLVILICPEKEEIYPEYMPTLEITDETEDPIDIRNYINEHTDITYLYPKEELLSYKNNYLLYKKYDSHWNSVGGYIAANELKKALGLEVIPLRDLTLKKVPTLDADLAYYGNTSVEALPMTFKYEFVNYKNDHFPEIIFIKNPITFDSFTSHCAQGFNHRVFVLGDSFRESMQEFLIKDFQELYYNTFTNATDDYISEEVKRSDVIVISLVERNEGIVLPQLCDVLCKILGEYKDEVDTFLRTNSQ